MTPHDAGSPPSGPEGFFVEGHLPGAAYACYVPLLRGEIAGTVRGLLPGASRAAPWLRAAILTQLETLPELLCGLEPMAALGHLHAATLTAHYLWPVWYELDVGTGPRAPDHRTSAQPSPTGELRTVRGTAERQVSRLLGGYFPEAHGVHTLCARQAEHARAAVPPSEAGHGPGAGGWLLLASVYALHGHPVLPRPGRRRRRLSRNRQRAARAGMAFEFGEALALATALGLLRAVEPEG
ncbi:hypothetical protein KBZ10_10625 [Streptomyces sp. F63]|uniref:hypothetical protein n=1 Tax=Streptomyces sp. F63 TaxID=2824887 RepID=UPI001B38F02F|nr:hypothetical protein [Streptomyces sp. F63]MBQ0984964.1 hypothetical protein [Streptomyces sp. F63]